MRIPTRERGTTHIKHKVATYFCSGYFPTSQPPIGAPARPGANTRAARTPTAVALPVRSRTYQVATTIWAVLAAAEKSLAKSRLRATPNCAIGNLAFLRTPRVTDP